MTSVVYRAAAGRDFDAITLKIAEDNPARAVTFRDELLAACERLADFPLRCALVPERGPDIRRLIHSNYLIFYRYDQARDQVIILRIVHGYRDLRKIAIE